MSPGQGKCVWHTLRWALWWWVAVGVWRAVGNDIPSHGTRCKLIISTLAANVRKGQANSLASFHFSPRILTCLPHSHCACVCVCQPLISYTLQRTAVCVCGCVCLCVWVCAWLGDCFWCLQAAESNFNVCDIWLSGEANESRLYVCHVNGSKCVQHSN